jgi:shikimate kinase
MVRSRPSAFCAVPLRPRGRHTCVPREFPHSLGQKRTSTSTPDFLPVTPIVHLVGPGGSGKTSTGPLLAQRLGWQFVDLDERFMSREGSIGASIEASGYRGYAKLNIAVYRAVKHSLVDPSVLALSSGFLTYPEDVDAEYPALCRSIEGDALTALLLPAFELEACVEIIVRRQLSRPYLPGNRASEERRIRERFPMLTALPCARFRSSLGQEQSLSSVARLDRDTSTEGQPA